MDRIALKRIVQDRIFSIQGDSFQDFVDQLCLKMHPGDYQPVRAGGRKGDMKNDGYCPKERTFYAAFGTRGTTINFIKSKIGGDLDGCLMHHSDVKRWIFITNDDKFVGEVETFIDEHLRPKYIHLQTSLTSIESWGAIRIVDEIFNRFEDEKTIAEIIELDFVKDGNNQDNTFQNGVLQLANQASNLTQNIFLSPDYGEGAKQDLENYSIINELLTYVLNLAKHTNSNLSRDAYDFVNIKEKLKINFVNFDDRKRVYDYLVFCFEFLATIEHVFSSLDNLDQKAIRHQVRTDYDQLKAQSTDNVQIFSELSQRYNTQHNERYKLLSRCLVVYFFDDCTIFEKTSKEALMVQQSLYV